MTNYTLGRGKFYFSEFLTSAGQVPKGFRYVGNTPEFNLTVDSETLDHFNSDAGVRNKDDSVLLETNRTGTLIMDDIQKENVALFFLGTAASVVTASATTLTDNTNTVVVQGLFYQIGWSLSNPSGARGVTNVVVKGAGGTPTYVLNTDYTLDADRGTIGIIVGGGIATGGPIEIAYDQAAHTADRVISGDDSIEGAIMYLEDNPRGEDHDIRMPWVKFSPNGDMSLKGDDWRQIPFNVEILKPTNAPAILRNGQPAYT